MYTHGEIIFAPAVKSPYCATAKSQETDKYTDAALIDDRVWYVMGK